MRVTKKQINDAEVQLDVYLEPYDMQPALEHTARHISEHRAIPGFRPGKAPYEVIKRHVGPEAIFKEALDEIINQSLAKAVQEENLKILDESDFQPIKLTPEEVSYSLVLSLYPDVSLPDWTNHKIIRKEVEVSEEELNKATSELARMLVAEVPVERQAKDGDSVVVDFEVLVDGKPIDKGSGKNHSIILGEKKMIPGFEEGIVEHKAGEEFSYPVKFPQDYAPHLAGKDAEVKIKLHQVLERTLPEINDEFAKRVGEQTKDSLINHLKQNIKAEKQDKEEQKIEIEAVKYVVESAKLGPIPDKAVNKELNQIINEFQQDLASQGIEVENYLKTMNKSLDDMKKEFKPKALERVKTSLVLNKIIDDNKISVSEHDIDHEVEHHKSHFRNNPEAMKDVEHPTYRKHLRNRIFNRKAVRFIVDKIAE